MNIKRGDIVTIKFPFTDKHEKEKLRPALIIQNDVGNRYSKNTIIIMISSSIPSNLYPVQSLIPANSRTGLNKESVADAGVIFTVSKTRIKNVIGKCPKKIMKDVNNSVRISLNV